MSIAYIRKTYGVDFKIGDTVKIKYGACAMLGGRIGKLVRAQGSYLVVKGPGWGGNFHPSDIEATK